MPPRRILDSLRPLLVHFHAIYQWTTLCTCADTLLVEGNTKHVINRNIERKLATSKEGQNSGKRWQPRPHLNETLNCHACLRYPMRIIPSYYWSWTWKKSSRRVGCVWCVGVSGCIDRRLQTSFLIPLEVMSLYLPHAAYKSLLCMQYLPYWGWEGIQGVRLNPIIKLTAMQHVATSQGRDWRKAVMHGHRKQYQLPAKHEESCY